MDVGGYGIKISLHGLLPAHWDHEPPGRNGPLSPALSPSEGERGNTRQFAGEPRFMERIRIRIKAGRIDVGGYGVPAQTHLLDRVGPKRQQRRGPEELGPPNPPQPAVELDVGLLPAERATAHQPPADDAAVIGGQNMRPTAAELAGTVNPGRAPAAVIVSGKGGPGVPLGRGQQAEPVAGEGAKELAHEDLGRGAGVVGDDIAAGIEDVRAARVSVTDDVRLLHPPEAAGDQPDPSRLTYIFHKVV
jgi:hypothetical protein